MIPLKSECKSRSNSTPFACIAAAILNFWTSFDSLSTFFRSRYLLLFSGMLRYQILTLSCDDWRRVGVRDFCFVHRCLLFLRVLWHLEHLPLLTSTTQFEIKQLPGMYHHSALLGNDHLPLSLFYHPLIGGCLFLALATSIYCSSGCQGQTTDSSSKDRSCCRELILLSLVGILAKDTWALIFIPWPDNVQNKPLLIVRQWVTVSECWSEESWLDILQIVTVVGMWACIIHWLLGKGVQVRS